MASEPDDYQSISDNCPGYMVLVPAGIICTRCSGEKRHKSNDCPKPSIAATLVTKAVPEADSTGTDHGDSGMESLSDTDSVSSDSTAGSESSGTRVTSRHQSDQSGGHSKDTHHLSRRALASPGGSQPSNEPDRSSALPLNHRAACEIPLYKAIQIHEIFSNANGPASHTAAHEPGTQSRNDRGLRSGPKSLASTEVSSFAGPGPTIPAELPSINKHSSYGQRNNKSQHRSRSNHKSIQQVMAYEAKGDRLPSASLADTTGKFEYSNTTCPSSFGFGRLPSEAMG